MSVKREHPRINNDERHAISREDYPASKVDGLIKASTNGRCPTSLFIKGISEAVIDVRGDLITVEFNGGWVETIQVRAPEALETYRAEFLAMISETVTKIGELSYYKGRHDARSAMFDAV